MTAIPVTPSAVPSIVTDTLGAPSLSRRRFIQSVIASAGAAAAPKILRAKPASRDKLRVALIGVGGRGFRVAEGVAGEELVAFCDVDDERASRTYQLYPDVPRHRDYRRMLDRLAGEIDAVAIATPDHMHYPIAMAALALGKHVYLEKPLTHTIWEARQLAKLSAEKKVATQMGNHGHSGEGIRLLKEWYDAGVLGDVRELHTWTDRPSGWWPQGVQVPKPSASPPPATLDWNLWLGVAAARPHSPAYMPFKWRGYWEFGTGALGDMGCHHLDGGFWVLELGAPTRVEAVSAHANAVSGPTASMVVYTFPRHGARPAVKWTWYDGGLKPVPPADFEPGRELGPQGTLIVGSKATVLAAPNYATVRIVPESKMSELAPMLPPKTIPRIEGGHFADWIRACKGGPPAGSNFSYAAPLTEVCLLGNIAIRTGRAIEWDAAAMRVTNVPEANQYVRKEYRKGFGV